MEEAHKLDDKALLNYAFTHAPRFLLSLQIHSHSDMDDVFDGSGNGGAVKYCGLRKNPSRKVLQFSYAIQRKCRPEDKASFKGVLSYSWENKGQH